MPDAGARPVTIRKDTRRRPLALVETVRPKQAAVAERTGRWMPGTSGNPCGRPRGSGNRSHVELRNILMDDASRVVRRVIQLALAGDMAAAKLILDRILPKRVCMPLTDVQLPAMRTAADTIEALGVVTRAMLDGRVSPPDAAALCQVVETFRRTLETLDHEKRIADLEDRQKARHEPPTPWPYPPP
jgi:hypothetical protein